MRRISLNSRKSLTTLTAGVVTVGLLLATGSTAAQASLPDDPPAPFGNPTIEKKCGANITLVLDASGSIGNNSSDVEGAANAFLEALKDTGSSGRVLDFATAARQTAPMTLITSGSLASGGVHRQALNSYYEFGQSGGAGPAPNTRITLGGNPTADGSYQNPQNRPQFTNWQEALNESEGSGTELVVFITDGDPTAATSNGLSNGSGSLQMPEPFAGSGTRLVGSGGDFEKYAFYKGVNAANALKESGSRMLTVGVGSALSNRASLDRLKAISGPRVYDSSQSSDFDINSYDVALVPNFAALGQSLRNVATELCSSSLTITKRAQTPDSVSFDPSPGWEFTVNPTVPGGTYVWTQPVSGGVAPGARSITTNVVGQAQFQWKPNGPLPSEVSVSETIQQGWSFKRAECRRLDDGTPSNDPPFSDGLATFDEKDFTVPFGADSTVTCDYYNSFDYQPAIEDPAQPVSPSDPETLGAPGSESADATKPETTPVIDPGVAPSTEKLTPVLRLKSRCTWSTRNSVVAKWRQPRKAEAVIGYESRVKTKGGSWNRWKESFKTSPNRKGWLKVRKALKQERAKQDKSRIVKVQVRPISETATGPKKSTKTRIRPCGIKTLPGKG